MVSCIEVWVSGCPLTSGSCTDMVVGLKIQRGLYGVLCAQADMVEGINMGRRAL